MLLPSALAPAALTIGQFFSSSNSDLYISLPIGNRVIDPDGSGTPRMAALANYSLPGPAIIANKGDTLHVTVTNYLTDYTLNRGTAIHWHGIHMHHNNEHDGAVSVTQCPLVPNDSFTYNVPLGDQSGTFWYHSHMATQYCDGLRGPLIIKDPQDPLRSLYDIDDESTIITLGDWYHSLSPQVILNSSLEWPDSVLINGVGRFNNSHNRLASVRAQPKKRHRYRIINMGCNPSYRFSIDNHTMTIIEADGVETQPLQVNQLEIFPGQRYSVVVEANQPINTYWIRANAVNFDGQYPSPPLNGLAILHYDTAPNIEPSSQPPAVYRNVLNEANLHPFLNPGAPSKFYGPPDYYFNFPSLNVAIGDTSKWFMGGSSYCGPPIPILLQIVNGYKPLAPQASIFALLPNKTVQVSFPAAGDGDYHPFHLHGHVFDVVRVAGSTTYNYDNPVRRDTVNSGLSAKKDNVTIQFRTDNAGPWFLHCHIDWHLEAGMAVVFAEDTNGVEKPGPDWSSLCPRWTKVDPDSHLPAGGGCANDPSN